MSRYFADDDKKMVEKRHRPRFSTLQVDFVCVIAKGGSKSNPLDPLDSERESTC